MLLSSFASTHYLLLSRRTRMCTNCVVMRLFTRIDVGCGKGRNLIGVISQALADLDDTRVWISYIPRSAWGIKTSTYPSDELVIALIRCGINTGELEIVSTCIAGKMHDEMYPLT